jgi:hypothetical protein
MTSHYPTSSEVEEQFYRNAGRGATRLCDAPLSETALAPLRPPARREGLTVHCDEVKNSGGGGGKMSALVCMNA